MSRGNDLAERIKSELKSINKIAESRHRQRAILEEMVCKLFELSRYRNVGHKKLVLRGGFFAGYVGPRIYLDNEMIGCVNVEAKRVTVDGGKISRAAHLRLKTFFEPLGFQVRVERKQESVIGPCTRDSCHY